MTHYEERLQNDLTRIRSSLKDIALQVQDALKDAVHALLTGNDKLAYRTILGDHPINRAVRALDRQCHVFIARHLPSAGHLRFIFAVVGTGIALERLGDYAVTICRESVQLTNKPTGAIARELELMANESLRMLEQATAAFDNGNAEAAKATMGMADQVERTFDAVFDELVTDQGGRKTKDLFALFVVFNMLERVSDQAKNICEGTVFAVTGEAKAPKTYKVLFLDEDNACLSPMAAAIAGKTFPHSGKYDSAGRAAAEALNPAMIAFMGAKGMNLEETRPRALEPIPGEISAYHAIVSLQGPVKAFLDPVPFHTTALEWDVGEAPTGLDAEQARKQLENLYREIALQVGDLMETLRGIEAS